MASEIRVDKINSLSGVGTVTLSPTGVDIAGITTVATLKATTGIVTTLTATTGIVTTLTTNTLTANSTTKVGSGVTLSPDGDVFATGITTISRTGGNGLLKVERVGGAGLHVQAQSALGVFGTTSNHNLRFISNSNERMLLSTNGNIGIGSDAPTHNLDIHASGNPYLKLLRSGYNPFYIGNAAGEGVLENTDAIFIKTGGSERVRIASNGRFGVGTNNPTSQVDIHCGSDNTGLQITSTDAGAFASYYDNTGASTIGHSGTDLVLSADPAGSVGSSKISFQVDSNTVRATIDSTGDLTISDGDLVIGTSGHGIDFSATSDGSGATSSELLDDYEEGTWTPVFKASQGDTFTTTIYANSYTKVGNKVFVQCYIEAATNTGNTTGNWRIQGLPFTARSSNHYFTVNVGYWNQLAASITYLTGTVQPNTNHLIMRGASSAAQQSSNLSYSGFVQTGTALILSATYITDT